MYPNLKAELARVSMSMKDLAKAINMPYSTLVDKIAGRSEFTFQEAVDIRKAIGVDIPLDELFKKAVSA